MNHKEQYSDEILNALIDGELEAAEEARILEAASEDAELQRRITELRHVKSLVLSAYADLSPPTGPRKRHWVQLPLAIAASLVAFVLGVALTWTVIDRMVPPAATQTAASAGVVPAEATRKVVFHVTRNDPTWLSMILQESENLLSASDATYVRIVASGEGLTLLQQGESPAAERIHELYEAHRGHLVFAGCGMTYALMQQAHPEGVTLLPEVVMVTSGVQEVMQRQSEGWTYVQI